jgi:hypothetical protein
MTDAIGFLLGALLSIGMFLILPLFFAWVIYMGLK